MLTSVMRYMYTHPDNHFYCIHFNTQNGANAVFVASLNGHKDVVDLLVQAGADINLATTEVFKTSHLYIPNAHAHNIF